MKKIISLFVAIVVVLSLVAIPVNAAGAVTVYLESSVTSAKGGDQFTVTLNSSEGSKLVGLSGCVVTYDKTRLDYISTVFAAGCTGAINNADDGIHMNPISTSVIANPVATITFKVKDGATAGDTVFGLSANEIMIDNPSSMMGFDALKSGFNATGMSVNIDTFEVTSTKVATADTITFTNTIKDAPMDGVLWAVLYNADDVLVGCGWVNFSKNETLKTVEVKNVPYTTAKVFVWTAGGYPILKEPVEVE